MFHGPGLDIAALYRIRGAGHNSSNLGPVQTSYFELTYIGELEEQREINKWLAGHFGTSGLFPNGKQRWLLNRIITPFVTTYFIRVFSEKDYFKVKLRFG